MIDYQENKLTLSLDDIRMEVSMRMRYLGLGFVRNRDPWLFLDYGTRVTVLVESVQERLHIPGIESPIECCSKLRLRRMCDEVLGVVHVIVFLEPHCEEQLFSLWVLPE